MEQLLRETGLEELVLSFVKKTMIIKFLEHQAGQDKLKKEFIRRNQYLI